MCKNLVCEALGCQNAAIGGTRDSGFYCSDHWSIVNPSNGPQDYLAIPSPDSDRRLREVELGDTGFRLVVWDTYRTDAMGKSVLGYALFYPHSCSPIFVGEDFGCSPCHAVDSDETLRAILGFLTLRPGDTDAEYFDAYTDAQLAFAERDAEHLSLWAHDDTTPLHNLD